MLGDAIDAAPRCNKRDWVADRPQLAFVLDGVNFGHTEGGNHLPCPP